MSRFIFILCSALLLSACSNFQFSSNLDKENFETYFQPSKVTIYEKSELADLNYEVIAAVEGSSCQIEANDPPADIREARTQARINADKLNANGVVFQTCITFEKDASCISNIICYGRALDVITSDE